MLKLKLLVDSVTLMECDKNGLNNLCWDKSPRLVSVEVNIKHNLVTFRYNANCLILQVWDVHSKASLVNTIQTIAAVARIKWRPQRKFQIARLTNSIILINDK